MRIILLLLASLSSFSMFSQTITLQNVENEKKTKILDADDYLELKLFQNNDNLIVNKTYYGFLNKKEDSKYSFDIDYENIEEESSDYSKVVYTTKEYFDTSFVKSFNREDIEFIVNHKRSESIFNNVASTCLYGLIISPLLCMNYKDFTINSENYLILAGGLTGIALVSYTITFTFGKKKFYIAPNDFHDDKNVWKLN